MQRRYTDEQLIHAVKVSTSIRQVLQQLGLVEAGGNYALIKRLMFQLRLDTSHFVGQAWRKGHANPVVEALPLDQILVKGSCFQSFKLKNRLLRENLKFHRCEDCGATQWRDFPIPLELHHINGNSSDNRLENSRLMCPNCHALTETYRGKNKAKCRDETAPT